MADWNVVYSFTMSLPYLDSNRRWVCGSVPEIEEAPKLDYDPRTEEIPD